jgi:hypothetical protein
MKPRCFLALAIGASLTGCNVVEKVSISSDSGSGPSVVGSGVTKTEERSGKQFDALEAGSCFEVHYQKGATSTYSIKADDNLLPNIESKIEDGKLILTTKGNFQTKNPVLVKVTSPTLRSIVLSGGAKGYFKGLDEPELAITLSGSANADIDGKMGKLSLDQSGGSICQLTNATAAPLTATLSGSSRSDLIGEALNPSVEASGDASFTISKISGESANASTSGSARIKFAGLVKSLTGQAEGASELSLDGLTADTAEVSTSGSSQIHVAVKNSLNASASGGSSIVYHGNPTVQQEASGSSTISKG